MRWSGDSVLLPGQRVELDEAERRWISRHPVVRLAVNDDLAPVAFFDANGNFNGILADLLQLVSLRTGLRFEFTRTGSFDSLQRALTDGKADLTVLSPTSEREECLRFSRPFTSDYFVLVARKDAPVEPDALQPPSAKRLAIARGHIATQQARAAYPRCPSTRRRPSSTRCTWCPSARQTPPCCRWARRATTSRACTATSWPSAA